MRRLMDEPYRPMFCEEQPGDTEALIHTQGAALPDGTTVDW